VLNRRPTDALQELIDGNQRFASSQSTHRVYSRSDLELLDSGASPFAAIVTCCDSRVAPEVLFDQPLGSFLVSRTPANVVDDGVRWMIDIAINSFQVTLLLVLCHSGCLAVQQVIEGNGEPGGTLRQAIIEAHRDALRSPSPNAIEATIKNHARRGAKAIAEGNHQVVKAVGDGQAIVQAGWYDGATGRVSFLDF
jgi:carbonic anhydrase